MAGQSSHVNQAFILGAGLGTRLRPLTDRLPKPLVPLFHRPLAEWAVEACNRAGIHRFAINTHHLPETWNDFGNRPAIRENNITLFHEPVLLETGGGLKNIASWVGGKPLLVHNGDIFSTMPLDRLIAAHEVSGLPVTLALRSIGDAKHIALDSSFSHVVDIRRRLGVAEGTHVFSGIYCVSPAFLDLLPAEEKVSVIPAFLDLAAKNQLGAVILDEGVWLDLGDRESYLSAHRDLDLDLDLGPAIHPDAIVETGAVIENSVIGPGAVIAARAVIKNSVLWTDSRIAEDTVLEGCVVCSGNLVSGRHLHADL